jgi:phosphatidylglycerol:prolipoprotein diacylglycerol transferase
VGAYVDVAVPAIALGYAVGRVGCFLNGDDYGVVTQLPWAVSYPPDTEAYLHHLNRGWIAADASASLPVHPVQLYLAALGLVVFLATRRARFAQTGQRAALCAVLYGCGRFVLELWRGDPRPMLGVLSLPQVMSIGLILAASLWYVASGRRVRPRVRPREPNGDGSGEVSRTMQMAPLH